MPTLSFLNSALLHAEIVLFQIIIFYKKLAVKLLIVGLFPLTAIRILVFFIIILLNKTRFLNTDILFKIIVAKVVFLILFKVFFKIVIVLRCFFFDLNLIIGNDVNLLKLWICWRFLMDLYIKIVIDVDIFYLALV